MSPVPSRRQHPRSRAARDPLAGAARDPLAGAAWDALVGLAGRGDVLPTSVVVDALLDVRNAAATDHERLAVDVGLTYVSGRAELLAVECRQILAELERMVRSS